MKIALLDQAVNGFSSELAVGLRARGHESRLVGDLTVPAVESLLRRRGFTPALSHIPRALAELVRGEFDVAHAFTPADAAVARTWQRMRGGPVVFTCTEVLERGALASGRLRLSMLSAAIEETNLLIAADEHVGAAIERWFSRSPDEVLAADDAAAHERLYGELIA